MVYYSAPITPRVAKMRSTTAITTEPDYGTAGKRPDLPWSGEGMRGGARGSAKVDKPYGELLQTDCENVAAAIADDTSGSGASGTGTVRYEFTVGGNFYSGSDVGGGATLPSYQLPAWPAGWGASLENRPAERGGPWNPTDDDPDAAPPPQAIGWEIVEPGRLVDAYVVQYSSVSINTGGEGVMGYVTLADGEGDYAYWDAMTAQYATPDTPRPVLDKWRLPPPDKLVYWRTSSIDPARLPQLAYVLTDLYSPSVGQGTTAWQWRFDPTPANTGSEMRGALDGMIALSVIFMWQPPTYRWLLSVPTSLAAPPLRQFPRDDALATGSAARHWPPPSSEQYGLRRGPGGYY